MTKIYGQNIKVNKNKGEKFMWKQNPDGTTDGKSFNNWMFEDAKRSIEERERQRKETAEKAEKEVREKAEKEKQSNSKSGFSK